MKSRWARKALALTGVAGMAVLIAAGCGSSGGGSSSKTAAKADQILKVNIGSDIEGFDPAKASYASTVNVLNSMFVGMYRLTGKKSEVTPELATDLPKVSDDGLTYTIKLRDDAKWSNGDPVTADDVVYGVQYALTPSTKAYFAGFMTSIVGACEMQADGDKAKIKACGDNPTDGSPEQLGVKALDEHTVEFKLARKVPWFDQLLTVQTFWPMPKATIEKFKDKWTDPANIVTSGAFTLDSYKRAKKIVVKRNADFYNADKVKLQSIEFDMIADAKTAAKQFELGKVDTGFQGTMISSADIDKWKTKPQYRDTDTSSVNYLYLNTRKPELKDPKVRQGISLAINRPSIVKNITKKGDLPLNTVVPTVLPGYDTIKEGAQDFIGADSAPDVAKAKELLKEGGWKDGTEITLYYASESASGALVTQAIQSDLAKVGVKVKLVPTPGATLYTPGVGVSPIDTKVGMLSLGWIADYLDAQDYYQLFTCDNVAAGLNSSNFCDPEFDKLYKEALDTVDNDARFDIYRQLEGMLTGPDGAMPAVPLYQPRDTTLVQDWVDGFNLLPSGLFYWESVQILDH